MQKLLEDLGPVTAVIGAQWGDEGKGKIVDILGEQFDVIARASGGANAGHTIVVDGKKYALHLLPSGCLHPGKELYLGASMVIHLPTLLEEIALIKDQAGYDVIPHLHISDAAHILFDYHKEIDSAIEESRSGKKLGTTKRGIGPAYAEKSYRTGLRMSALTTLSDDELRTHLEQRAQEVKRMFDISIDVDAELANLKQATELIGSCIADIVMPLNTALAEQKTVLIEGAQATFLDIDHGTYPFVTSSATTIQGALQGLGIAPQSLTSCIGVVKAYCTRVGDGPFQTEIEGEHGDVLRERGGEYGATTGRPRRCGWLPLHDLKRAAAINGFTHLNLTKLDVLDEEEKIPVYLGKKATELPGWKASTKGLTIYDDLPENAQKYIENIEKESGIPVSFIGTGPGREEMISR